MIKLTTATLPVISILIAANSGCTLARPVSAKDACKVLLIEASHKHLAAKELASGHYDCEYENEIGSYLLLSLHYRLNDPNAVDGSNLVGWYAVSKASGQLYEWDMANQKIGDALSSPSSSSNRVHP